MPIVKILQNEKIERWLPVALSSLFVLVASYGMKRPPKIEDVLESWGLPHLAAPIREAEKERGMDAIDDFFATPKK